MLCLLHYIIGDMGSAGPARWGALDEIDFPILA